MFSPLATFFKRLPVLAVTLLVICLAERIVLLWNVHTWLDRPKREFVCRYYLLVSAHNCTTVRTVDVYVDGTYVVGVCWSLAGRKTLAIDRGRLPDGLAEPLAKQVRSGRGFDKSDGLAVFGLSNSTAWEFNEECPDARHELVAFVDR